MYEKELCCKCGHRYAPMKLFKHWDRWYCGSCYMDYVQPREGRRRVITGYFNSNQRPNEKIRLNNSWKQFADKNPLNTDFDINKFEGV